MKTAKKGRAWALLSPKVLRKAREREGMSRKALAERLGVSPGAVQNWEADASTPSQEMQQKIVSALKLNGEPTSGATTDSTTAGSVTAVLSNALASVATARAIDDALVPEKPVADAAAKIVSAMINKGMLTSMDEIKKALQEVETFLRG